LPVFIVGGEGLDDAEEEWVLGNGSHSVVGDAGRHGAVYPGGVGEEWV